MSSVCPFGSSPRVRGKPLPLDAGGLRFRLIPACAGKTGARPRAPANAGAHPRVCGENVFDIEDTWEQAGSSPRVRGKRATRPRTAWCGALIPACAGKTLTVIEWSGAHEAHPRVCGENLILPDDLGRVKGSSPRVRGKRHLVLDLDADLGLIPACAGKTTDYFANGGVEYGSSPRVRGKPARLRGATKWTRLIPACAGKTPPSAPASTSSPAHPRVCGENSSDGFPRP